MSDLVIVAFQDEATAFEARAELVRLQKEYLIEMEDAVVVTRNEAGEVKLHQAVNLTAAGAVSGGMFGMLIGLLFLNPILGAAAGAGAGALSGALSDAGIDDTFLKDIGQSLDKGQSAVAVLIRKMTADKLLARMDKFRAKGRVIQTSLSGEAEAKLREVLERTHPMGTAEPQLGGNTRA
ncbi:DUF1269 domain-containing protein [Pseudogemmobacter blasticus]|uniref:DUF1269 domain-containing protein n=1 Tax=Fuscovulum blasticum DSM 2131 TaxID=1188250 RepID=A0A2T4JEQ5_FUSBL|nr:DUF1269 domain-containing protein [Fuscovulum blasticum]AWD23480.1 hypothetical protein B6K69_11850 [Fuscovulum blasticum]PTE16323.1 hypothetical protein C5F44_00180 [Fuscovulum blasticum DSM 2131]